MDIFKEEEDLVFEHEYDGIRELDNSLPPWWIYLFHITIIFSVVYFAGYEIFGWFDQPKAEYQKESKAFAEQYQQVSFEDTVALTDSENLKAGAQVFKQNCTICHGDKGQGGAGPNLTDYYWKNGKGTFPDIADIVYNGRLNKNMPSWKHLGKKQVLQVTSYTQTLLGTTPPKTKAPEGKLYKPEPPK